MGTGTVVRFDRAKGFGFITPDNGGDDLFLHASVFCGPVPRSLSGARVRFQTVTGERGVRAVDVEIISRSAEPVSLQTIIPARGAEPHPGEVLSPAQYGQEITDVLVEELSGITGAEISRVRDRLVAAAGRRRWVEQDEELPSTPSSGGTMRASGSAGSR